LNIYQYNRRLINGEISKRRIQKPSEGNRITVAVRFGRAWAIPKDAEKPIDARKKPQNENKGD
jgi:hypothetical protein